MISRPIAPPIAPPLAWPTALALQRTTPPIDPLTVEYWDAEYGITLVSGAVDVWTGQRAGIALIAATAPTRPLYVADSSFKNTNVVQCAFVAARCLGNTPGATILATGSRPYTISVIRSYSALPGSTTWGILSFGVSGASNNHYVFYQTPTGSNLRPYYNSGAVRVEATPLHDQLAHVIEFWPDGTNLNCRDNSALYQTATNITLSANCSAIGLSRPASSATQNGDINHVFHMVCSAKPSDAYIATLRAWLTLWKGAP